MPNRRFPFPARVGRIAHVTFALALIAAAPPSVNAATPPALVNYQGVLRDQNDKPLSGSFDMTFRFMDAATAGNEILIDRHLASTANAVSVSGGLFNVALGSGTVVDGSGSGSYTSLDMAFRDFGAVWLEIKVGTETLSPRTRLQSAPYALNTTNAAQLNGQPASFYLDASSAYQVKPGPVRFSSSDTAATASVAAICNGTSMGYYSDGCIDYGGFFQGTGAGGTGVVGNGGYYGVRGYGTVGGYFADNSGAYNATLGDSPDGVGLKVSGPTYGAYFSNGSPYFGYTYMPYFSTGQVTYAQDIGGEFRNWGWGSLAFLAHGSFGIKAYGGTTGGEFHASGTSSYIDVGYSSYKISGNGSVSFVQNHPLDASRVVVYAAPEGDEVAVYTRGSARLVDGEARVALGETFALVANPDIGLTATVTPIGDPIALSVVKKSTRELTVRGPAGSNAVFDYAVWGLRIGFEEQSIVQPKQRDSKIPSMHQHESFFTADSSLRAYTALARFKGIDASVSGRTDVDLSGAAKLRDAIGVFPYREPKAPRPTFEPADPAGAPENRRDARRLPEATGTAALSNPVAEQVPAASGTTSPTIAREEIDLLPVEGAVETGDLVSLSATSPGSVVRSAGPGDPLVIGCAQIDGPGVISSAPIAVATSHIALCRVDASLGAIAVGDRLSASPDPGVAAKADPAAIAAVVIGRAIEPLQSGTSLLRVLLGAR